MKFVWTIKDCNCNVINMYYIFDKIVLKEIAGK